MKNGNVVKVVYVNGFNDNPELMILDFETYEMARDYTKMLVNYVSSDGEDTAYLDDCYVDGGDALYVYEDPGAYEGASFFKEYREVETIEIEEYLGVAIFEDNRLIFKHSEDNKTCNFFWTLDIDSVIEVE